jgi:hypothetical protein
MLNHERVVSCNNITTQQREREKRERERERERWRGREEQPGDVLPKLLHGLNVARVGTIIRITLFHFYILHIPSALLCNTDQSLKSSFSISTLQAL